MQVSQRSQREISCLLNAFTHPLVRDLAWVIGNSDLLSSASSFPIATIPDSALRASNESASCVSNDSPTPSLFTEKSWPHELYLAWSHLQQLDQNPHPLISFLIQHKDIRLGAYFEKLIHYWIQAIKQHQNLITELQIHDQKKTLGAFDILTYDDVHTHAYWQHWELTLKFYLCYQGQSTWNDWIGPGGKDRLAYKLERMQTHQFMLAQHTSAQSVLQQHGVHYQGQVQQQRIIIKGIVFDAYQRCTLTASRTLIQGGYETHGIWIRPSQLKDYLSQMQSLVAQDPTIIRFGWRPCYKPHWLAPFYSTDRLTESMWYIHPFLQRRQAHVGSLPLLTAQQLNERHDVGYDTSGTMHSTSHQEDKASLNHKTQAKFQHAMMYSVQTLHTHLSIPAPFDDFYPAKITESDSNPQASDSISNPQVSKSIPTDTHIQKAWQEIHRLFIVSESWPNQKSLI